MPETNKIEKKRKTRQHNQSDSEESQFVPVKRHDQYQRWSEHEHNLYVAYLQRHFADFHIEKGKKRKNLFMRMAEELQCHKSNEQCRTHHQKMLKKYLSIENIIHSHHGSLEMPISLETHTRKENTAPREPEPSFLPPVSRAQETQEQKTIKPCQPKNVIKSPGMEIEYRAFDPQVFPMGEEESENERPGDLDLPLEPAQNDSGIGINSRCFDTPQLGYWKSPQGATPLEFLLNSLGSLRGRNEISPSTPLIPLPRRRRDPC